METKPLDDQQQQHEEQRRHPPHPGLSAGWHPGLIILGGEAGGRRGSAVCRLEKGGLCCAAGFDSRNENESDPGPYAVCRYEQGGQQVRLGPFTGTRTQFRKGKRVRKHQAKDFWLNPTCPICPSIFYFSFFLCCFVCFEVWMRLPLLLFILLPPLYLAPRSNTPSWFSTTDSKGRARDPSAKFFQPPFRTPSPTTTSRANTHARAILRLRSAHPTHSTPRTAYIGFLSHHKRVCVLQLR